MLLKIAFVRPIVFFRIMPVHAHLTLTGMAPHASNVEMTLLGIQQQTAALVHRVQPWIL